MGMADPREQTENKEPPRPMYLLQAVFSSFADIAKPLTRLKRKK
jgi:hypothetical protein